MLKMVGEGARGSQKIKIVVFGLSHQNLARLKEGKPITFPGEDVAIPGVEFLIFAGETEQAMAREMADLIGSETNVSIDPRLRD